MVKENIETGYNITENNKAKGCDIVVEIEGQDEPRDVLNCKIFRRLAAGG